MGSTLADVKIKNKGPKKERQHLNKLRPVKQETGERRHGGRNTGPVAPPPPARTLGMGSGGAASFKRRRQEQKVGGGGGAAAGDGVAGAPEG